MRRTILLGGVLPFVSAFLGGVLAFSLVAAPRATAQSSQAQEVRASAFILEAPDGTVLAQLAPGGAGRNGNLTLYNAAGTRRLTMNGAGLIVAYEQDGTTAAFRAGRQFAPGLGGSSPAGFPPVNGVELGPDGSISRIPPSP